MDTLIMYPFYQKLAKNCQVVIDIIRPKINIELILSPI